MLMELSKLCNHSIDLSHSHRSSGNANAVNAQRNNGENPKGNGCFKCGATWHFKRDCPKLKNKDEEKGNAPGWVYAVGNTEKRGNASRDPDSNVPLPPVVSPTHESPGYVAESDPEEDLEEYEDDETEDGPVDYPMDGGDDGDDDDGDSSGDDADDEDEDEEDEDKEKEEHLAPADFVVVIPIDELAAISFPPKAEVERLLAMPTPLPSPLASLSPPSAEERLARCTAPTALPSPPLPPPLHMPPPIDRRDDIPETEMPPCKSQSLEALLSQSAASKNESRVTEDPYVEVALQAPPSLEYMPSPEEPEQASPSPDYVPGPEHADDEIVAEDQPYTEDASPIAQSPEYVQESDFEAHPEDNDDEDLEEDPVDYPADGGDDGDDEEESSEDEEDDEMDVEADEEEDEE
nr:hypothetical protein [Tanacetum cinerariifolium]